MLASKLRQASGGKAFDPDAVAIIDAMTVTPDGPRQDLINDLVVALKDANVWTELDMLYVHSAHDEQAGRINWIDRTVATNVNAGFTTDVGFFGNATSWYLDSGLNLNALTNYTQNNAHIGMWQHTNNGSSVTVGSISSFNVYMAGRNNTTGNQEARVNSSTTASRTIANGDGHHAACKTSSTNIRMFSNGVSGINNTVTTAAIPSGNFAMLRNNTLYSNERIRFSHVGGSLSDTEVLDLYNALNAYVGGL